MAKKILLPAGREDPRAPPLFEHEGNAGFMDGDWKLVGKKVTYRKGVQADARWRFHHLPEVPFEQ